MKKNNRHIIKPGNYCFLMLLATAIICFNSCGNKGEQAPDVSGINVTLQTYRFDKDLYAINPSHIPDGLKHLAVKYPDFLNYFLDTLRAFNIHGNYDDTASAGMRELDTFLTNKDIVALEEAIKAAYPDNNGVDKDLTAGFKFMKYYIPAFTPPRIIYLNMGLATRWAAFPVDTSTLCVGLDMFLGEQYPHYKDVGVPAYMLSHFRSAYLPVSVFNTVYQTMYPFSQDDKTLLDLMIQRGKEQYFLHKVLPHTPDSVLFGFTTLQLDWCSKNEGLVYNFFIHQNLLYNKEGHSITPYVYDGPFAKDLESPSDPVKYTPGNIGTWMGYKLVCAYMAQHPGITLAELLHQHTDPPKFLEEANYRPK